MSFADNINRICAIRGTNLTHVIKQLKNGQSSYTTAINKKGSVPNEKDLIKLAEILNCSVMDFFVDNPDMVLNQNNNAGTISNNVNAGETYNTNNYYSACGNDTDKSVPITSDSKEYFFTVLDKLRNMDDSCLLEMIRYADFVLSKNEGSK